jgi:hypothetical protein
MTKMSVAAAIGTAAAMIDRRRSQGCANNPFGNSVALVVAQATGHRRAVGCGRSGALRLFGFARIIRNLRAVID